MSVTESAMRKFVDAAEERVMGRIEALEAEVAKLSKPKPVVTKALARKAVKKVIASKRVVTKKAK